MKNYKKRIAGVMLGTLTGLLLTGCGAALPEMTPEQEDQIVNYAAALALRYHGGCESRLVDLSLYDEEEEKGDSDNASGPETPEDPDEEKKGGMDPVKDTATTDISETNKVQSTIEGFLGLEGIRIEYAGAFFCDTYPEESEEEVFFSVDATPGMKILAVPFDVHNDSDHAVEIDFLAVEPKVRLILNGGKSMPILTTPLLEDMTAYQGTVEAGETLRLVILAEVEAAEAGEIRSLEATMKSDAANARITLQ